MKGWIKVKESVSANGNKKNERKKEKDVLFLCALTFNKGHISNWIFSLSTLHISLTHNFHEHKIYVSSTCSTRGLH